MEIASSITMIGDTSSFSSISHTATRMTARSTAAMRSRPGTRACAEISESMRRRLSATPAMIWIENSRERSLSRGDDAALAQEVAQHVGVGPHAALVGLVDNIGRALAGLRARGEAVLLRHYSVTRPEYEPSRVSTLRGCLPP